MKRRRRGRGGGTGGGGGGGGVVVWFEQVPDTGYGGRLASWLLAMSHVAVYETRLPMVVAFAYITPA